MAAHAARSPSGNHQDNRSIEYASREHDIHMRNYDRAGDYDMDWQPEGHRQRRSSGPASTQQMQENIAFADQRYCGDSTDAPAPRSREHDNSGQLLAGFMFFDGERGDRDEYRREHDVSSINRVPNNFGKDARDDARGHHEPHYGGPLPRYERLPPPSRRENLNANDGSTRASTTRRPSPNYSRVQHSRTSRQSHNPRGRVFFAQLGNPNAMPIGKRGAEAIDDTPLPVSRRSQVTPAGFATEYNVSNRVVPNEEAGSYMKNFSRAFTEDFATKALPLSEVPPNIHPSRRAVVSRERSVEGDRHIANMRAPRKQLDHVAPSFGYLERRTPDFLTKADNANAVPLGKKMRF